MYLRQVNSKSLYGRTALHIAATKGNAACVELILDAGAEVNVRSLTYDPSTTPPTANGPRVEIGEMAANRGSEQSNKCLRCFSAIIEVGACKQDKHTTTEPPKMFHYEELHSENVFLWCHPP